MRPSKHTGVLVALVSILIAPLALSCRPVQAAEGYVAIVPQVMHSGSKEAISLSLFGQGVLIPGNVEVTLLKGSETIVKASDRIDGKGTIEIDVPEIEAGEYQILVKGNGFTDRAQVIVEKSRLLFLETDKPIYKPGQTIQMRAVTLNGELKPVTAPVTVEVLDAKGIKIFREQVETDEYGMASLDLPVSTEPNLGVWKINAETEQAETQLDVRIEEYVLPKYEVTAELPKEWFLVSEPIEGIVTAEYSFGKPVAGELEIKASRYVGQWEEYATFSKAIDGEAEFELPSVDYVAGVPEAGGMGNVMLEITVREEATGYAEQTSRLLTVAASPLNIQLIPEGSTFKPGLPFSVLIITETPDSQPVEAEVAVEVTYLDDELEEIKTDEMEVETTRGKAVVEIEPPRSSVALVVESFELTPVSSVEPARASQLLEASYSPSASFIHVEQISEGVPQVGEEVSFRVHATREAANFYYEVVARDKVVFSDYTKDRDIVFATTPLMAPAAKLLVYQVLPNSEVAADYLPFKVAAEYPHAVEVAFSQDEAKPGDSVTIDIETEGAAKVGIAAVDKSVFILAENRLNLEQVFAELERLYMEPQAELHEVIFYPEVITRGAQEIFEDAGVVVLSNSEIPEGKEYQWQDQPALWDRMRDFFGGIMPPMVEEAAPVPAPSMAVNDGDKMSGAGLVEVERVRQYFPETWLWDEITVGANGRGSLSVDVPDTITTWMLRAIAISREHGLGIAEDELKAFQPFFVKVDLPYSAIRGEEFPVKVAVYNYLETPQRIRVKLDEEDWFDLRDDSEQIVEVAGNNIGGAEFTISPTGLGVNELKITAQSSEAADAVIKTLIVEPEGIAREVVDNLVVSAGEYQIETLVPPFAIPDSGRAYLALTSSYLTQTMEGLEELIQMPFGCGEQNMIVFAPDVYITKYLEESGQLKPEIMAKAELLMITGYQRELTYRRNDGSFSAFGQSDEEGSLWLTAFVLKAFSQAKDLIFIDEGVLADARDWIVSHQNSDGSFDPVGFVHHQEMLGGLQGKTALTAYTAIALMEAGEEASSAQAVGYLEGKLDEIDDAYTMAITSYALELAQSDRSNDAYQMLMDLAHEDEDGLHWGEGVDVLPEEPWEGNRSAEIETTAYATLALIQHGDAFNASRAAQWLVSRRNAYGGFGSTQDTVVTLQALVEYATDARADVDLTIEVKSAGFNETLAVTEQNFDLLQIIELPVDAEFEIEVAGKGEAIAQVVKRFNLPETEPADEIISIDVDYDTTQVEVDDLVTIAVDVAFNPPQPMEAGMIVLDISIPTGFEAVTESIAEAVEQEARIKRYDIAGRKVIFYVENMLAGDSISFSFQVMARYPVKAKGVSSQAYSYYQLAIKGETLGEDITVN